MSCFWSRLWVYVVLFPSVMSADLDLSPPEVPEPTLFESLLRYGLFLGAIFQLICVLAIIIPSSKSHEQVRILTASQISVISKQLFLNLDILKCFISGYGNDGFLCYASYCTRCPFKQENIATGENIGFHALVNLEILGYWVSTSLLSENILNTHVKCLFHHTLSICACRFK